MAIELHDITVPVFLRGFAAMAAFLEKGRAHADAAGIQHSELLEARLIEDMHPLPNQVQRASDAAKFTVVRIAGVENLPMEDNEASFADLQSRIVRTMEFLKSVPADALNGREGERIEVKLPNRTLEFTALDYVRGFALPNFYFHVTTAYAILRHKGVPVGKVDFLGGV
jgi:uncharacterized protein